MQEIHSATYLFSAHQWLTQPPNYCSGWSLFGPSENMVATSNSFFLDIGKHEFRTSRKQHLAHGSRKDTGNSWYEYLGMPGMPLKSTNQNVPYIIYIYMYIYNYTYIFIYIGFHL